MTTNSKLSVSGPQVLPKPSKEAQSTVDGAKKVLLSDVYGTTKRKLFLNRAWGKVDVSYTVFMLVIHGLCLFAPATFSWPMVGLFLVSYFISGESCFIPTPLQSTRPCFCSENNGKTICQGNLPQAACLSTMVEQGS